MYSLQFSHYRFFGGVGHLLDLSRGRRDSQGHVHGWLDRLVRRYGGQSRWQSAELYSPRGETWIEHGWLEVQNPSTTADAMLPVPMKPSRVPRS